MKLQSNTFLLLYPIEFVVVWEAVLCWGFPHCVGEWELNPMFLGHTLHTTRPTRDTKEYSKSYSTVKMCDIWELPGPLCEGVLVWVIFWRVAVCRKVRDANILTTGRTILVIEKTRLMVTVHSCLAIRWHASKELYFSHKLLNWRETRKQRTDHVTFSLDFLKVEK